MHAFILKENTVEPASPSHFVAVDSFFFYVDLAVTLQDLTAHIKKEDMHVCSSHTAVVLVCTVKPAVFLLAS